MTTSPQSQEPLAGLAPRGRKRGVAILFLVIAVIAGTVAASELTTARELEARTPVDVAQAGSGTAYCPVTPGEGRTASLVLTAATEVDAQVTVTRFGPERAVTEPVVLLPGGTSFTQVLEGDLADQPVVIEWAGGPVLAQTQLQTADELLAANCATEPSPVWHLVGFDTTLRAESLLHLFNPFLQDATVSLAFGTEAGPVELVRTEEINVPGGRTVVLDLKEFQANLVDLAVTVTTVAGRVIPQGEVLIQPPGEDLEGVRGRELIPAAPQASELALLPSARVDDTTSSWLTVYNPQRRSAAVQVGVSTPLGDASTLATETTIPAGGTTRISLAGVSALPDFGVRVVSVNGVGVVVTRTDAIIDGDQHAVTISLAAPAPAETWVLPGVADSGSSLMIYNPDPVLTQATVTAGGQVITSVDVSPNGLTVVPIDEARSSQAFIVTSSGPVVAGIALRTDTGAWSAVGISPQALLGGGQALRSQRDPRLGSIPAISATATPTPDVIIPDASGEGGLGDDATEIPSTFQPVAPVIATPTATPSPEPTPTPTPSATPAPAPSASDPGPAATEPSSTPTPGESSSPDQGGGTEGPADEEGDLFG